MRRVEISAQNILVILAGLLVGVGGVGAVWCLVGAIQSNWDNPGLNIGAFFGTALYGSAIAIGIVICLEHLWTSNPKLVLGSDLPKAVVKEKK